MSAVQAEKRSTTANHSRRAKSIGFIKIPKTTSQLNILNMTVLHGDKQLRENYASTIMTNSDSFFQSRFQTAKGGRVSQK